MLKVNTGNFWSDLPNKISIANSQPKGMGLRTIKVLVPEWQTVTTFKNSRKTAEDWAGYEHCYENNLRAALFYLAAHGKIEGAELDVLLVAVLERAAAMMGVSEITLCCWEKEGDPHCHRHLLYSYLPEEVRGANR